MPYFKFHKAVLIQNIKKLTHSFRSEKVDFGIFYSVKTNFSDPVLETINKHCSFEIVSDYEWEKVKKYSPTEIVLNGPSKSSQLVQEILNSGVKTLYFNIDNDTDIEIINTLDKKYQDKLKIGLRVFLNKSGIWNRFGFDVSSKRVQEIISDLNGRLVGFHFHFSTNNFDIRNYEEILTEINRLVSDNDISLSYVDIGGGLPGASDQFYQKQIYHDLPSLIQKKMGENILIISEVGRNLVENVMDLHTQVVSIKNLDSGAMDIVVDANIMHFPCFWEKKYDIDFRAENVDRSTHPVLLNIFGNSCMQIDTIAENYLVTSQPKVGDIIVISKVGAYSLSQASNFITKIPAVL